MSLEYRIGDVVERLAEIPDGSIDLIVTSPPFLALRSYLPADHPDKHKEIGSEPTPAAFIDTLLGLSAEFARVLAPHGSICIELGDTYSGGGGENHLWDNGYSGGRTGNNTKKPKGSGRTRDISSGWPLAKSLTGIPTLYAWSLAYGRNLLTGQESPAGQWRIRNVIVWARPNPPVGSLGQRNPHKGTGDAKFRPATSYITVACKGTSRYFDLDAVRTTPTQDPATYTGNGYTKGNPSGDGESSAMPGNPAGAPPLDWHADDHPEDGDWLWKLSTQPYAGSHYATYPMKLPKRLIEAMCPLKVCVECGKASERVSQVDGLAGKDILAIAGDNERGTGLHGKRPPMPDITRTTVGWTDCGHDAWRTGVALDPFAGSGTTLEAAQAVGRHAIGIDLDARNADLAQQRVGMFLTVTERAA
jgi:site-specific DNA-methyltransferase (adenine-specific)